MRSARAPGPRFCFVSVLSALLAFTLCSGEELVSTPEGKSRAAALDAATLVAAEAEDVQISNRILRLMQTQIDRFLADLEEEERRKALHLPSGVDEASFEEQTGGQARALVKRIAKNLKPLGTTLWKFDTVLKQQEKQDGEKEAQVGLLERELAELKDSGALAKELEDLKAEKKQLSEDKDAMVRTVQSIIRQTQGSKVNSTLQQAENGAEARQDLLKSEYTKRIQALEAEVEKATAKRKELAELLEAEKQKKLNARNDLGSMNATSEEYLEDQASLKRTLEQVQEEHNDLVNDKTQLMQTLKGLLHQNSELREQVKNASPAMLALGRKNTGFIASNAGKLRLRAKEAEAVEKAAYLDTSTSSGGSSSGPSTASSATGSPLDSKTQVSVEMMVEARKVLASLNL